MENTLCWLVSSDVYSQGLLFTIKRGPLCHNHCEADASEYLIHPVWLALLMSGATAKDHSVPSSLKGCWYQIKDMSEAKAGQALKCREERVFELLPTAQTSSPKSDELSQQCESTEKLRGRELWPLQFHSQGSFALVTHARCVKISQGSYLTIWPHHSEHFKSRNR